MSGDTPPDFCEHTKSSEIEKNKRLIELEEKMFAVLVDKSIPDSEAIKIIDGISAEIINLGYMTWMHLTEIGVARELARKFDK